MIYCRTSQTSWYPPQRQLLRTLALNNQSRGCSVLATRNRLYPWESLAWCQSLFSINLPLFLLVILVKIICMSLYFAFRYIDSSQTLFKQNHQNYLIKWWNPAEVGIPVVIFPPHTHKQKVAHVRFRDSKRNTLFIFQQKLQVYQKLLVVVPIKPKRMVNWHHPKGTIPIASKMEGPGTINISWTKSRCGSKISRSKNKGEVSSTGSHGR